MAHLDQNINILSDLDWPIWFPKSDNETVFSKCDSSKSFLLICSSEIMLLNLRALEGTLESMGLKLIREIFKALVWVKIHISLGYITL